MTDNVTPEITQKAEEVQTKVEDTKQSETASFIKTDENQENWRKYREQREVERKQRQEAEQRAEKSRKEAEALKAAMDAILNKPNSQENTYQDDDEDKRIERKIQDAIEKDRQRAREEAIKHEQATFPQRLTSTYKDFNNVCNSENLDYLDFHYPEIVAGYKHMPEGYDKWSAIYQAVKKFVPFGEKKEDAARINRNMQKPQAATASLTDTKPETLGWKLTEERRKANWARMQADMKGMK
jgi:hypothetical protein